MTMDKVEIYKNIKERYHVVTYEDSIPLKNNSGSETIFGIEEKPKKTKLPKWVVKQEFLNSEEKYVEHYGDKLAMVELIRYTVVIEKTENKVSFKFFHYENLRYPGRHWFKKFRNMWFITLNTKNGLLYTGSIGKLHNKRKSKKIHTNRFWYDVSEFIDNAAYNISTTPEERNNLVNKIKIEFIKNVPDWKHYVPGNVPDFSGPKFYEYYLYKKGVKVPDNLKLYRTYQLIPPTKLFKKVGNKFIDAVMLYNGLHGDVVRKTLHEVVQAPTVQIFKFIASIVGLSRILQRPDLVKRYLTYDTVDYHFPVDYTEVMSESEKKNAWKCLNTNTIQVRTLRDHAMFIFFLRQKNLNVKWKAKDENSFALEHKFLSDEYDRLKNGVSNRIYPKEYYDLFKEPLKVQQKEYNVLLLDSQYEFHQESDYQQNCVKTYIQKPGSFIFSVRNGKDRATVEYYVMSEKTEWQVERVQSLGRFNKSLDSSWHLVLDALDNKVKELIHQHGYTWQLKKIKGDTEKVMDFHWDSKGRAVWKNTLELIEGDDYFF